MYAGSKYESHYTVWTAWISIRVRVRVRVYFILLSLAPPGTTVHVPTAGRRRHQPTLKPRMRLAPGNGVAEFQFRALVIHARIRGCTLLFLMYSC